ncbi:MAG: rod shape-determining protein MreC, partial [Clostridia bacterium]
YCNRGRNPLNKISKKLWIVLLIVTGAVLGIMCASAVTKIDLLNTAVGTVVTPLQKAVSSLGAVGDFFDRIANAGAYKEENKILKERIARLEQETINIDSYKNENERLRALLEMKDIRENPRYTGANVISRDSGDWYETIVIDKGTNDGVNVNSVVVVPDGLVGSVFEAGPDYAKVKTMTDVESSVGAICGRTNDIGIVEGKSGLTSKGKCALNYLDKNARIVEGDSIETSGTGGVFPKGIRIGKVTSISDSGDGLTLICEIETAVNPDLVTEVLVSIK